ncbi:MAG: hypothetical protein K0Q51_513 [Rickettsiaceae bacterium]|jgi:hypothetical protein|nr:hypothetical protein [Rickettsiaceae bacterium]
MNNKLLQGFISGFLSCFRFLPPTVTHNKEFDKTWQENWTRVTSYFEAGFKKLEEEYERNKKIF